MTEKQQSKKIPPAAKRALVEAEQRRKDQARFEAENPRPTETGGRNGPEPTRYGDWERSGILSDF